MKDTWQQFSQDRGNWYIPVYELRLRKELDETMLRMALTLLDKAVEQHELAYEQMLKNLNNLNALCKKPCSILGSSSETKKMESRIAS